jgi:hypothetical protein
VARTFSLLQRRKADEFLKHVIDLRDHGLPCRGSSDARQAKAISSDCGSIEFAANAEPADDV